MARIRLLHRLGASHQIDLADFSSGIIWIALCGHSIMFRVAQT